SLTIDGLSGVLHQGCELGAYASGWPGRTRLTTMFLHGEECTMSVTNQLQAKPPMQCKSAWQYVYQRAVHASAQPHAASCGQHSPIAGYRPAPFGPATLRTPLQSI
ncbi:hypothetical protein HaLaN_24172, partial [Haematococcus lacustris]